jgi:hypothetical protein
MTVMNSSSDDDFEHSDVSSTEFDSDGESKVSSIATESVAEDEPIFEPEPVGRLPGEVDLSGFHDVCRKILAKKIPDGFKTGILCRLKHSSAADRRQLEKERKKKVRSESKMKKNWENLAREKPNVSTKVDKQLEHIAKRGVVDFFNAIEKHQSDLKRKLEEAGPTELRRSKVIKNTKEKDVLEKIADQQNESGSKWLTKDSTSVMEAELQEAED